MNHFQQILEDPNILRTTSSCTDNYSGDSFDMHNFQISLLGGQGDPLTYCQITLKKNNHHRAKSTTQLASGCSTNFYVPRLAWWHAWHDPEWGSPEVYRSLAEKTCFFFSWKKSSRSMETSPLPPTKKRENIQTILNEFWGSNLFQIWSKKWHHPRFHSGPPMSLARKSSENGINQIRLNVAVCWTSSLEKSCQIFFVRPDICTKIRRLQKKNGTISATTKRVTNQGRIFDVLKFLLLFER